MPDDDRPVEPEPPLEGVLTAEEIEDALRNGITFADLLRDLDEPDRMPPDNPSKPNSV